MDFINGESLLALCAKENKKISEVMLEREITLGETTKEEVYKKLAYSISIMKNATTEPIKNPKKSIGGLLGGEAKAIHDEAFKAGAMPLCGGVLSKAIAYAMAVLEVNASMGLIVAAPTAGLHFTKEMLEELKEKGVKIGYVTLHVGLGTFRPVKEEMVLDHKMHREHYDLPQETADLINKTKAEGGRVIAVGTTSCRTLESVATFNNGKIVPCDGYTEIFIYPGYEFKVLDGLITNFHLPESTLIMLVSAFLGYDKTMNAYKTAVEEKYRFFSFGDSMCIL